MFMVRQSQSQTLMSSIVRSDSLRASTHRQGPSYYRRNLGERNISDAKSSMTYNSKIMRHPESRQTIEKVMENGQTENGIIRTPGKGQPPNSRGFYTSHDKKKSRGSASCNNIRRTYSNTGSDNCNVSLWTNDESLVRVSLQNQISQSESFLGDRVTTLHTKTESLFYEFGIKNRKFLLRLCT